MAKLSLDVRKCKSGAATGLQKHDQREPGEKHSNKDIDDSRTHLNYDIHNSDKISFTDKINQRIKDEKIESKRSIRSDANVMISVVVQQNKKFFDELGPERTKEYFKAAYDILSEKYGEKNIIAANVHMDEKAPHLHLKFVPIQDGKLIGGKLTNKPHLIELHTVVAHKLRERGFDVQRGDADEEKREHLTPEKFKVQEMQRILKEQEQEMQNRNNELRLAEQTLADKERKLKEQESKLKATAEIIERAKSMSVIDTEILKINQRVKVANPLFGQPHVDVDIDDFNKLAQTAIAGAKAVAENEPLKKKVAEAESVPALKKDNARLSLEVNQLRKSVTEWKEQTYHTAKLIFDQYKLNGLDDIKTAAMMLKVGKMNKDIIAKTIASSNSAPAKSDEARKWANNIVASVMQINSSTISRGR